MSDRNRLIELIVNADTHDSYECRLCTKKDISCIRCDAEKFADYLLANGVIVPPCKVGDTVYTNYNHLLKKNTDEIFECKVVFIGFYEDGNYINLVDNYEHLHSMDFETFSKTVFLTKGEAEKALAERSGNNA